MAFHEPSASACMKSQELVPSLLELSPSLGQAAPWGYLWLGWGLALGCSPFLPIRVSFYFSPLAVGLAGATQGCPFASQGKKKRASHCLS